MDLAFSVVLIQAVMSVCSGVRYFKECDGERKEESILLPKGKILEMQNNSFMVQSTPAQMAPPIM